MERDANWDDKVLRGLFFLGKLFWLVHKKDMTEQKDFFELGFILAFVLSPTNLQVF